MTRQLDTTVTGFGTQLPERLLTSAPRPSPLPYANSGVQYRSKVPDAAAWVVGGFFRFKTLP